MTQLTKTIRRVSNTASKSGRRLIIIIDPGAIDLVTVREQGRRRGYSVPLEKIYQLGARIEADNAIKERKAKRKAKQSGKGN